MFVFRLWGIRAMNEKKNVLGWGMVGGKKQDQ